jgi:hypothetical protein
MRFTGFLHFLLTGDPFSPKEIADVRSEINFTDAIDAHLKWKDRLRHELLQPPVNARVTADVGDEGACVLGRWIMGPGYRRYGHLASFAEVRRQHSRFHRVARDVVELHYARRFSLAEELMSGDFEDASEQIIRELRGFAGIFGN